MSLASLIESLYGISTCQCSKPFSSLIDAQRCRIFVCGHHFCHSCAEGICAQAVDGVGVCAACEATVPAVDASSLPIVHALERLAEQAAEVAAAESSGSSSSPSPVSVMEQLKGLALSGFGRGDQGGNATDDGGGEDGAVGAQHLFNPAANIYVPPPTGAGSDDGDAVDPSMMMMSVASDMVGDAINDGYVDATGYYIDPATGAVTSTDGMTQLGAYSADYAGGVGGYDANSSSSDGGYARGQGHLSASAAPFQQHQQTRLSPSSAAYGRSGNTSTQPSPTNGGGGSGGGRGEGAYSPFHGPPLPSSAEGGDGADVSGGSGNSSMIMGGGPLPPPGGVTLTGQLIGVGGVANYRVPSTTEIMRVSPTLSALAATGTAPTAVLNAIANLIRFVIIFVRPGRRLISDVGTVLHRKGLWPVPGLPELLLSSPLAMQQALGVDGAAAAAAFAAARAAAGMPVMAADGSPSSSAAGGGGAAASGGVVQQTSLLAATGKYRVKGKYGYLVKASSVGPPVGAPFASGSEEGGGGGAEDGSRTPTADQLTAVAAAAVGAGGGGSSTSNSEKMGIRRVLLMYGGVWLRAEDEGRHQYMSLGVREPPPGAVPVGPDGHPLLSGQVNAQGQGVGGSGVGLHLAPTVEKSSAPAHPSIRIPVPREALAAGGAGSAAAGSSSASAASAAPPLLSIPTSALTSALASSGSGSGGNGGNSALAAGDAGFGASPVAPSPTGSTGTRGGGNDGAPSPSNNTTTAAAGAGAGVHREPGGASGLMVHEATPVEVGALRTMLRKLLAEGPQQLPTVCVKLREARLWPLPRTRRLMPLPAGAEAAQESAAMNPKLNPSGGLKLWILTHCGGVARLTSDIGPSGGKREWLILANHDNSNVSDTLVLPAGGVGMSGRNGGETPHPHSLAGRAAMMGAGGLPDGADVSGGGSSQAPGGPVSAAALAGGASLPLLPPVPVRTGPLTYVAPDPDYGGFEPMVPASPKVAAALTALPPNHPLSILRVVIGLSVKIAGGVPMPRVGVILRKGGHWPPIPAPLPVALSHGHMVVNGVAGPHELPALVYAATTAAAADPTGPAAAAFALPHYQSPGGISSGYSASMPPPGREPKMLEWIRENGCGLVLLKTAAAAAAAARDVVDAATGSGAGRHSAAEAAASLGRGGDHVMFRGPRLSQAIQQSSPLAVATASHGGLDMMALLTWAGGHSPNGLGEKGLVLPAADSHALAAATATAAASAAAQALASMPHRQHAHTHHSSSSPAPSPTSAQMRSGGGGGASSPSAASAAAALSAAAAASASDFHGQESLIAGNAGSSGSGRGGSHNRHGSVSDVDMAVGLPLGPGWSGSYSSFLSGVMGDAGDVNDYTAGGADVTAAAAVADVISSDQQATTIGLWNGRGRRNNNNNNNNNNNAESASAPISPESAGSGSGSSAGGLFSSASAPASATFHGEGGSGSSASRSASSSKDVLGLAGLGLGGHLPGLTSPSSAVSDVTAGASGAGGLLAPSAPFTSSSSSSSAFPGTTALPSPTGSVASSGGGSGLTSPQPSPLSVGALAGSYQSQQQAAAQAALAATGLTPQQLQLLHTVAAMQAQAQAQASGLNGLAAQAQALASQSGISPQAALAHILQQAQAQALALSQLQQRGGLFAHQPAINGLPIPSPTSSAAAAVGAAGIMQGPGAGAGSGGGNETNAFDAAYRLHGGAGAAQGR